MCDLVIIWKHWLYKGWLMFTSYNKENTRVAPKNKPLWWGKSAHMNQQDSTTWSVFSNERTNSPNMERCLPLQWVQRAQAEPPGGLTSVSSKHTGGQSTTPKIKSDHSDHTICCRFVTTVCSGPFSTKQDKGVSLGLTLGFQSHRAGSLFIEVETRSEPQTGSGEKVRSTQKTVT